MEKSIYAYKIVLNEKCIATTLCSKNESKTFIIDRNKNDTVLLIDFIVKNVRGFVGFGNLEYDQYFLHKLTNVLSRNQSVQQIKYESIQLMESKNEKGYNDFKSSFAQLDLARLLKSKGREIHSVLYNNNLNIYNPDPFQEGEDNMIANASRVQAEGIYKLYESNKDGLELRRLLMAKTGMDFYNVKEPDIMPKLIRKIMKIPYKAVKFDNRRIHLSDVIFDDIKFKVKEFQDMKHFFEQSSVYQTSKELEHKMIYKDVVFTYKTGGFHASVAPGVFEGQIFHIDVKQFYPSILNVYKVYPRGIGPGFNDAFEKAKSILDGNHKLSLNSVIGKMGSPMNPLYDKEAFLKVNINAQLIFSSFVEQAMEACSEAKILSIKTDGIFIHAPERSEYEMLSIIGDWQEDSGFDMKFICIDKMVVIDSNNTLSLYKGKIVQQSGVFKKFSVNIVTKALIAYFKDNIPVADTVMAKNSILDYAILYNASDKARNYTSDMEGEQISYRSLKYVVVKSGGIGIFTKSLTAKRPTKITEHSVELVNEIEGNETNADYDIDYSYYITIAETFVKKIVNEQLELF